MSHYPQIKTKIFPFSNQQQVNGDGLSIALSDLDSLKAEIVREMRLEIQKAKQEIIEGLYF